MIDSKIGIAGMGTVGTAVYHAFSSVFPNIVCYDKYKEQGEIKDLYDCQYIFMCLPDVTIVERVANKIVSDTGREDIVFIVKTTMPIGATDKLQTIYGNNWCFNPEFLTDRTANQDFMNQDRIILGGDPYGMSVADEVEELYRHRFRHVPILKTTHKTAEFVKLMTNMYFMTKITFMNEMFDMARAEGLPWDSVVKLFSTDSRINYSHLDVPGPDGKQGFGGKCFPANIEELLRFIEFRGHDSELIPAVKRKNDKYR
jgi:UDPglucose 6-dehydrogenase